MTETFIITYKSWAPRNSAMDSSSETMEIDAASASDAASVFKCLYPNATVESVRTKTVRKIKTSPDAKFDFALDGVSV